MAHRYAVYLTPDPEHPLWSAGGAWLGRDPSLPSSAMDRPPAGRRQPWYYGFHATLKAPMRLAPGLREEAWIGAVQALAADWAAFECPALQVSRLGTNLALRPTEPVSVDHPLWRLARACVTELDGWRAPLSEAELRHRLAKTVLDTEQQDLLARWGYPHVLHRWHWHFTLTDRCDDPALLGHGQREAQAHFAQALAEPMCATALTVFVEEAPGVPLRLIHRAPLLGAASPDAGPLELQKSRRPGRQNPGATVLV